MDNDTPGITLASNTSKEVSEPSTTDSFTLVLDSEPTADVVITVSSSDATEATATSTLTFTSANWDTPQVVTITAVDDDIVDGTQTVTLTVSVDSTTDVNYSGLSDQTVSVGVLDNDTPGITLASNTSKQVSEPSTTDSFTLVLDSEPTADVVITVSSSDATEATATSTLTFTSANWDTPQVVTITAVDDDIVDGTQTVTLTVSVDSTTDVNYSGLSDQTVSVDVLDNDTPGITLASNTSKQVSEPSTTDSFTLVLDSEPTADVVITVSSSDATEATATSTLTFRPDNWDTPQIVTITAVDDDIVDGTQTVTLTVSVDSTTDVNYSGLSDQTVSVDVLDNDTPGITLASNTSKEVSEPSTTDSFTLVLDSEPTADVVITVSSSDATEATATSTLTFTSANWDTPQVVTITAVDD